MTARMTATEFDTWVTALRSGEYNQASGSLAEKDLSAFCCLGVKCHAEGFNLSGSADGYTWALDTGIERTTAPPLRSVPRNVRVPLSRMNDNGATFDEIADWLVENRANLVNDEVPS